MTKITKIGRPRLEWEIAYKNTSSANPAWRVWNNTAVPDDKVSKVLNNCRALYGYNWLFRAQRKVLISYEKTFIRDH